MRPDGSSDAMNADRFAGCLVGQALGDALGSLVEGHTPEMCAAYVDRVLRSPRINESARGVFAIGQYSDDTQLARELVRSFLHCGQFDPEDYARRIAALFTENRIVGPGLATEEAALRIAAGVPWQAAGAPAPAAGNGSAMRAAPVGLLFAHEPETLVVVARDQGRITHQDPRCAAGAIAIAGATAIVVREPGIDPAALCAQLARWTSAFDPLLAAALREMPSWIQESPHAMVETIASVGMEASRADRWQGISPFVTGSVLWSLYSVLRSPRDYWESICTAIAVGGDVDTTAAMAGAVSGAAVGLAGLPSGLVTLVTDQGEWGYEALVELAHDLHALHCRQRTTGS